MEYTLRYIKRKNTMLPSSYIQDSTEPSTNNINSFQQVSVENKC